MTRLPAYILAGGKSSRFGSDKALAMIDGKPLIARIATMIQPIAKNLTVVADVPGKYDALSLATIGDVQPDLGPLGGLLSALLHRRDRNGAGWVILCSCDLLIVKPQWFELLWQERTDNSLAVAFKGQRWQGLVGLYHSDLIEKVQEQFQARQTAIWQLLEREDVGTVASACPPDWPDRLQANRPGDLPAC